MAFAMRILAVAAAAVALAGCGTGADAGATDDVDLRRLVTVLPTPPGLDFGSSSVRDADAAAVQEVFAREARAEAAQAIDDNGLEDAAIRAWSGPDGAALVVVASRWPDHQRATNWGAGAAELPLGSDGAKAWTPRELPGARGSRITSGPDASRALSLAVGEVNVFVRADGPVAESDVIETLERSIRQLEAAVDEA